ncbi:MAG: ribbon-helix-helix protein, CopG family [Armatimonadota bacterium]|nr:ribbon-helix-helix protein, CopG family [Armatimonadota bacterium]
MSQLTERLEIRVPAHTLKMLREEADRRGTSVARLVREAIEARLQHDREARLQAAQALFRVGAPVADWPHMEQEIAEARGRAD